MEKSHNFIVTPPLYSAGPSNENTVHLMYVGPQPAADREKIYYLNAKAIPSVDEKSAVT
ncbi:fimbria/pilus periplasmic chaperone [Xanthomonas cassavae CFBP 4642]|uniref:Fimbria/pilus periplasmic chaperone n=1 Tax=Xanthomonas cassavae CFBP 4642 TaxID=1219375 RepID=A0ABS8HK63_9XANT|nr:fimbria/pilus periplasmic chaperone [Xanthomonas cassavae CFBP 4642]